MWWIPRDVVWCKRGDWAWPPVGQVVAYIEHGGALDVARAADGCARVDSHSMHMRADMQRTP